MANDIDFNKIDSQKENTLNLVKETDNFIVFIWNLMRGV